MSPDPALLSSCGVNESLSSGYESGSGNDSGPFRGGFEGEVSSPSSSPASGTKSEDFSSVVVLSPDVESVGDSLVDWLVSPVNPDSDAPEL